MVGMFNPYGNSLVYEGQVRDMANIMTNIFAQAAEIVCDKTIATDEVEIPTDEEIADKTDDFNNDVAALSKFSAKIKKFTGSAKAKFTRLVSAVANDPHPTANGHKEIADIMKTELSGMVNQRMSENAVPAAEKVTVSKSAVTITAGNTYKLGVTVAPFNASQSVKWKSSNPNVASVGKKAVCKVTVNKKPSALKTILKSLFKK